MPIEVPDWEEVSRELVRALRGRRSREAFARRLGCSANAVYAWETGRRIPPAFLVLRAAGCVGIDIRPGLAALLGSAPPWLEALPTDDPSLPGRLIDTLRGSRSVTEVADRAKISRFALSRWSSGRATPRMPDLLRVIQVLAYRALDLVAILVDPASLPSARAAWSAIDVQRRSAVERPWIVPVEMALELEGYRALPEHDPGWIAARLDIDLDEVERCLVLLEASGRIWRRGGRYEVAPSPPVQIAVPEARRRLRAWCTRVAEEHIRGGSDGLFASMVFAASDELRHQMEEICRRYIAELRALASETSRHEHLMVSNIQLFPMS